MEQLELNKYLLKLKQLQKNAYAPYSNFRVAAIIILENNKEVHGVNVENAAFPVTICAERAALSQVITLGYKPAAIKKLFLLTDSNKLGSPCGMCRQFMVEIMPANANIFICNANSTDIKSIQIITVKDLLPHAFSKIELIGNFNV